MPNIFCLHKHFIFINRDDFVIYYILLMYNWRKIRSWKAKTYKHTAHFKLYIVMTPRYLVVITCKNRANFCCCCTSRKYIVVYEVKMLCRYFLLHTHARQYLYKNSYYVLIRLHGRGVYIFGLCCNPLGAGPWSFFWLVVFWIWNELIKNKKSTRPGLL